MSISVYTSSVERTGLRAFGRRDRRRHQLRWQVGLLLVVSLLCIGGAGCVGRQEHEAVKKELARVSGELQEAKKEVEALRNSDRLAFARTSGETDKEKKADALRGFIAAYPGSSLRQNAEATLSEVEAERAKELAAEQAEKERLQREEEATRLAEARKHSLKAQFDCSMFGTPLPLLNCLDHTEIKIRTGGNVTLLTQLSLASSGLVGSSVSMPISAPFHIAAQNGLENATLTLKIVNGNGNVCLLYTSDAADE